MTLTALLAATPLLWYKPSPPSDRNLGRWDWHIASDYLIFKMAQIASPEEPAPRVTFATTADRVRRFDSLPTDLLPPLIGERCAEIVERIAGADVQLVEADVQASDGPVGPYWVVNAVRQVRCIDFDRSITIPYATNEKAVAGFQRLTLVPGSMGDAIVARDADYLPFLYAAMPLVTALRKARLRGLAFLTAEKAFAHLNADPFHAS